MFNYNLHYNGIILASGDMIDEFSSTEAEGKYLSLDEAYKDIVNTLKNLGLMTDLRGNTLYVEAQDCFIEHDSGRTNEIWPCFEIEGDANFLKALAIALEVNLDAARGFLIKDKIEKEVETWLS